jgi:hypothetical protein
MALLVIRCRERDVSLSLEMAADLAVKGLLVGFHGQEHVGPLGVDVVFSEGVAPAKNDCVVWSASAWIRTPSRSRLLSSSYCFAEACG